MAGVCLVVASEMVNARAAKVNSIHSDRDTREFVQGHRRWQPKTMAGVEMLGT